MSDDVAVVLAAVPCLREDGRWRCDGRATISKEPAVSWHAECLTAAGYAVVKLPGETVCGCDVEGHPNNHTHQHYAAVAHGARLVPASLVNWGTWEDLGVWTFEEACEHLSADGIDQSDGPDKVWRCNACGWLYRSVCDENGISRMVEVTP